MIEVLSFQYLRMYGQDVEITLQGVIKKEFGRFVDNNGNALRNKLKLNFVVRINEVLVDSGFYEFQWIKTIYHGEDTGPIFWINTKHLRRRAMAAILVHLGHKSAPWRFLLREPTKSYREAWERVWRYGKNEFQSL